jgi:hypothetical protein
VLGESELAGVVLGDQRGASKLPGVVLLVELALRVAGRGERRETPVEAGEEPRPQLVPPVERSTVLASRRQHARGHEPVGGHV